MHVWEKVVAVKKNSPPTATQDMAPQLNLEANTSMVVAKMELSPSVVPCLEEELVVKMLMSH